MIKKTHKLLKQVPSQINQPTSIQQLKIDSNILQDFTEKTDDIVKSYIDDVNYTKYELQFIKLMEKIFNG